MAVELFLTNIFFYRVPKIPLLKETFTMRKIFLLLTVRHQMYTQILIHHTSKVILLLFGNSSTSTLEFLDISTLLKHSVTIDYGDDSTLIIFATKRKYFF